MADYQIVMTSREFIDKLMHIAFEVPNQYKNYWPQNLGYYNSNGRFSWDCWNLPKSLIWGWKEVKKVGYYQPKNLETGLGDWSGAKIMTYCTERSTDFSKITPGEFMMNGPNDHAGIYVGEFTRNGRVYNVIECTVAFGGGVVPSYVSSTGLRYSSKGGNRNGSWARHGKLSKWIDYNEETVHMDVKVYSYTTPTMKGGEVISIQALLNAKNNAKLSLDGSYGPATEKAVKAYQKKKGLTVDGICGEETWKSLIEA